MLNGIIDTGADVTVISQAKWPPQWPLAKVSQTLAGIGGTGKSHQRRGINPNPRSGRAYGFC